MFKEDIDIKMEKILFLINESTYTPMTINDMAFLISVPPNEREFFNGTIEDLEKLGKIIISKKGKIMSPSKLNMVAGEFQANARGFGFVITKNADGRDIFIPPDSTNGAMNKDFVMCRITSSPSLTHRSEGEIVSILKRGMNSIVGRYVESKGLCFVVPDNKKIPGYIDISPKNAKGAVTGHKVVLKIIKPPSENQNPEGKIIEILGHCNDPGIDILSIIMQYELSTSFPDEVYEQIEAFPDKVVESDLTPDRKDLRNIKMVTIDGEDAKDLDDAVSLEKLANGNYKLGVHIADVTNYVKEGSPLDKEAYKRATSVYLVDRVIPMLPHKLSNGICSLNANVDRLALSCIMELDNNGTVISHEICNSIIHVDKRMSYTIVADLLTNESSEYLEENLQFMDMFRDMETLSEILKRKRIKRGAIEFDFAECKIILDEDGKPVEIKARSRNIATSIIEEFMLVCNETVAEEYFWLELPFVYRTHGEPDSEKMLKLSKFITNFGYHIKGSITHPKSIQALLSKIESTPEEMIISRIILRSFKQARYSPENEGHFGLAAKYYSHFTSPIRRYPDLQIHRIIKENLNDGIEQKRIDSYTRRLPEITKHCSMAERVAEEAERETNNLKKVEYMADKVGEVFDGIISSITSWGIFVELPNTIEGMIQVNSLGDDYYEFDPNNIQLIGEFSRKTYKLGDAIRVKVEKASIEERRLYFLISN